MKAKARGKGWILSAATLISVIGLVAVVPTPTVGQTRPNSPSPQLAQGRRQPTTVNGRLDSSSNRLEDKSYFNVHTFEGKAGESITIDLSRAEFKDAYLMLLSPDNKVIANNYEDLSGSNTRISITLPTSGTYKIVVNTKTPEELGNYTLSWREATAADSVGQSRPNSPSPQLPQGKRQPTTVNSRLDSSSNRLEDKSYFNVHKFEGKAGESVTIDLTSSEFDVYLILLNPDDNPIAKNDDGGGGSNARISITLPTSGTYKIVVNGTKAGELGNYTLSWREATAADLELAN